MTYRIEFQKAAVKFLKKQDKKTQTRILQAVKNLPEGSDIKKLKGYDLYRLRVGDIRVIYDVKEEVKIVSIESINNRGDVYKRY